MNRTHNIIEPFCPPCLAVPLALAGAGAAGAGAGVSQKEKNKRIKTILIWSGISTLIFAVGIAVYYLFIKKCKTCK